MKLALAGLIVSISGVFAMDKIYSNYELDGEKVTGFKTLGSSSASDTHVKKGSASGSINHKIWEIGSGGKGYKLVIWGSFEVQVGTSGSSSQACRMAEANGDVPKEVQVKESYYNSTPNPGFVDVQKCLDIPVKIELIKDGLLNSSVQEGNEVLKAEVSGGENRTGYFGSNATKTKVKFRVMYDVNLRDTSAEYFVKMTVRDEELESKEGRSEYSYDGGGDWEEQWKLFLK